MDNLEWIMCTAGKHITVTRFWNLFSSRLEHASEQALNEPKTVSKPLEPKRVILEDFMVQSQRRPTWRPGPTICGRVAYKKLLHVFSLEQRLHLTVPTTRFAAVATAKLCLEKGPTEVHDLLQSVWQLCSMPL